MKIIKNILLFSLLAIVLMIGYNCTRPKCMPDINYCDTCASYYPEKDTFKLGDTLWFKLKIPKLFPTECGYYEFKKDSLKTCIGFGYSKIIDSLAFLNHTINEKKIIFKIGSVFREFNSYNFIYDKSKGYYINEFGVVLEDTGKIYLGCMNNLPIAIKENVNPLYKPGGWRMIGSVYAFFTETDTSFFSIYVKPYKNTKSCLIPTNIK